MRISCKKVEQNKVDRNNAFTKSVVEYKMHDAGTYVNYTGVQGCMVKQ